ncbi:MAG: amidohydrolase family protein [Armatimonadetes bacterium]|nr:amidohydrolase family protein [Armatimonadota bacterium]
MTKETLAPRVPEGDLIIRGATIFDGSGAPGFQGDIMVRSGRITAIGACGSAAREIEATGLFACPGFVDIHGHSDLSLLADRRGISKLLQGVTTEAIGQCGMAPFPVPQTRHEEFRALLAYSWAPVEITWRDAAGYLAELGREPLGINVCPFLGANVAALAPGRTDQFSAETLEQLWGLSLGLAYMPLCQWPTEDLDRLAAAAAGKTVAVHLRNEGARLLESLTEALSLAQKHPVALEIAHLKASRRENWGKMRDALAAIEEAKQRSADVAFSVYPYSASSTFLAATLPDWLITEGQDRAIELLRQADVLRRLREDYESGRGFLSIGPENILVAQVEAEKYSWAEGMKLSEAAEKANADAFSLAVDMILAARGQVNAVFFSMSEEDVRQALAHPLASVCTDGLALCPDGPTSRGKPHPRCYGAFARFLGHYVRDEGLMDWPEAIRKCTSWPASRLGLRSRGLLRPGYAADIVIFDPQALRDTATFDQPHRPAQGIRYVIVNGVISVADGQFTGALGGQVLDPKKEQRLRPVGGTEDAQLRVPG